MKPWLKIAKSLPLQWNKHVICPKCSAKGERPSASINNNIHTWSIYCYKCKYVEIQDKGVLSLEELRLQKEALAKANEPLNIEMPLSASVNFTAPAREWLQSCGISVSTALAYGLRFNEETQGVLLPTYTGTPMQPRLEWIQERGIVEGAPKYRQPSASKRCTWSNKIMGASSTLCVVVEDIASGVRVAEAVNNQIVVYSLMGTQLNDSQIVRLIEHEHIILWLDNDKAGQDAVKKMRPVLSKFSNVYNLVTEKDPKKYSNDEIQKYIMQTMSS